MIRSVQKDDRATHPHRPALSNPLRLTTAALLAVAAVAPPALAAVVGISGTMSNFDVFNETGTNAYGAELELEGCHSSDVTKTYPSHFDNMTMTEFSDGARFGTRITFTGYNFDPVGYIIPTVGMNTNGHYAVNLKGCEHFGFAVRVQPTATRYYWLDQNQQRIGTTPLAIPTPTWTYVPPPNPVDPPIVRARVEVPEPAEVHVQRPDSIWMKVYKTEIEREVDLLELISGPDSIVPQDEVEIETEWELLEGGKMKEAEAELGENGRAVIRRYEFFKYTGPYDAEHEPTSAFLDGNLQEPPEGELGDFIAANMVAVNFLVPEPATLALLLAGGVGVMNRRRHHRGR
ncbi:MAG: hypothetical protein AMXMBFR83_31780 [Phycisphaerae bacterium]